VLFSSEAEACFDQCAGNGKAFDSVVGGSQLMEVVLELVQKLAADLALVAGFLAEILLL